jgi:hypothetical protein
VHGELDRRTLLVATIAFFAVSFFAFAFFYLRMAILWDADSYYHLAVARLYAESGIGAHIPWARFSLLANGGDKDFLFHLFLMPFSAALDPAVGGRLALAVLNAALATAVANLAARAIGAWGFAVPLWLWIAAPPFFARVVRLRPELIALLVILIAIPFAAKRNWLAVGLLAAIFTWAYTAFHVFLALCVIWWLLDRFRPSATTRGSATDRLSPTGRGWREAQGEGRVALRNLAFPFLATAFALVVRPHPIANAKIWFVQNVMFFLNAARLDVGDEIRPPSLQRVGVAAVAWIAALAVLAVIAMRSRERAHPLAQYAAVPAVVFTILFFGMSRMATYFFPLATIAILLAIGPRLRAALGDGKLVRYAIPATLAISTLVALPVALNRTLMAIIGGGPVVSEADWESFGKAVPRGAKVAASWGDAETYALWAPQGRYLNVLDPVFMAFPYPRQYAEQRAIFDGRHPDVPFAAKSSLDSDFVALDWSDAPPVLIDRMKSDPRLRIRYGGYNLLAEIVPSNAFIVDWVVAGRRYPRAPGALAGFEGFVDAARVSRERCVTFTKTLAGPHRFAFAPYGQSAIAIDGRVALTTPGLAANLARAVPIEIAAGPHRVDVRTCVANGFNGFYLRQ